MIDTKISGSRLRLARELRGYATLKAFSAATGNRYSETRLNNYETGFRAILPNVAQDLGQILDCSPAWLLCLDEAREALSPDESRLVARYRAAYEVGRQIISRVAESIPENPEGGDALYSARPAKLKD